MDTFQMEMCKQSKKKFYHATRINENLKCIDMLYKISGFSYLVNSSVYSVVISNYTTGVGVSLGF